jgi:magnesium-transporting ATPase (P-type)
MFAEAPWVNRFLLSTFFISIGLQMAVIYFPFMQKAFHTKPPTTAAWALILVCAIVPVVLIDRVKALTTWREKRASRRAA